MSKSINQTLYFEDFSVGSQFHSYSRTITETDIVNFCCLVGYHTPLFIDEEYAKKTKFGKRIAPGSLTASYSTASIEGIFRDSIIAHLENRKASFLLPVAAGDTITTHVEVIDRVDKGKPFGQVVFRDTVKNQNDEVVYCIEKVTLVSKRDA